MDTVPAKGAAPADPQTVDSAVVCREPTLAGTSNEVATRPEYRSLDDSLRHELWQVAGAGQVEVSEAEFGATLEAIGSRHNFGCAAGTQPSSRDQEAFWRALHLQDLGLALGCALGRDAAWQRFMAQYRGALIKAAQGITRSAARGEELADALYGELFGFVERDGLRRSPLERYSARGSLMSWLRALLAQQQVNQFRKTARETPIEDMEPAALESSDPEPQTLGRLRSALPIALAALAAEERLLLSAYYLDGHSLQEVGRVLRVHEATVSRKLKRAAKHVRKELLRALEASGLSRRGAEEVLGTDPRDIDVNLRKLLQNSSDGTYPVREGQS